jgi:hypothetical protein
MLFEWLSHWVLRLRRRGVEESTLFATQRRHLFRQRRREWVALTARKRNEL